MIRFGEFLFGREKRIGRRLIVLIVATIENGDKHWQAGPGA